MSDLISRADVLEGLKHSTAYLHDDIYTIVNRIPSAETTGALDEAIAKYVADGYMLPPSGDYIRRADAIEAVVNMQDGSGQTYEFVREAIFALNALPSADAVQGEWKAEIGYEGEVLYYECSNCKEAFSLLEGTPEENKYHFCPNCGARMTPYKGGDE